MSSTPPRDPQPTRFSPPSPSARPLLPMHSSLHQLFALPHPWPPAATSNAPAWLSSRGKISSPPFFDPADHHGVPRLQTTTPAMSALSREVLRCGLPRTLLRNIAAPFPPPPPPPKRARDEIDIFAAPEAAGTPSRPPKAPRMAPEPQHQVPAGPSTAIHAVVSLPSPYRTGSRTASSPAASGRRAGGASRSPQRVVVPSLHCHICTRAVANLDHAVCGGLGLGKCRKVVCVRCFEGYGWDLEEAKRGGEDWRCPHCQGECPGQAQCFAYNRATARRKERRAAQRRERGGGAGRGGMV
eukprot:CAMPEP_0184715292 /NCGR_PEP_ID=MMETSP0314-20130426/5248_1 /TAXON_ID=38298 /ORGANISM="Rhodella maculata, Strain CCMP 736" /LENGTH=297 /DNA_ID=CAMNT_0027178389 /DNA_START=197 /DNA_END=1090 /DNA_ORIENTATION=+